MGKSVLNLNPRRINSHSLYQLQPPVKKERFNEDHDEVVSNMKLSTVSAANLHRFNKESGKQAQGPRSVFSSHASGLSRSIRAKSAFGGRKSVSGSAYASRSTVIESHKKRIIDAVNNLNEEELEKVSEMLKVAESLDARDNNQEGEPDAVTAPEELPEDEVQGADGEEEEQNPDLDNVTVQTPMQEAPEEAYSSVSRAPQSQVSGTRSVVSSLQKQLDEERFARIKLERDLQSLQRIQARMTEKVKAI